MFISYINFSVFLNWVAEKVKSTNEMERSEDAYLKPEGVLSIKKVKS